MHGFVDLCPEIVLEPFLVLFRPGTTSVRSGRGTFFVPEVEHAKHLLCSLFTYVVAVSGGWLQPGLKVREAREVEAQPNSS